MCPSVLAGGTHLCFGRASDWSPSALRDRLPNSAACPNSALFNWSVLLIQGPHGERLHPLGLWPLAANLRGDLATWRRGELEFQK